MHGQMTGAVAYPRPADKGAHLPKEMMLTDVRWYVAYPLSTTRSSDPLRWEALLHYQCASMWGRRSPRNNLLSSIIAALDTRRFRVIRRGPPASWRRPLYSTPFRWCRVVPAGPTRHVGRTWNPATSIQGCGKDHMMIRE